MGVDIDRVRAAYDEIGGVELVDFKEWPKRAADALVTMINNVPDMLAELAASRQRVSELEAQLTKAESTLVACDKALASREAALREIEAIGSEAEQEGFSGYMHDVVESMRDRAAQEVGRG